MKKNKNHRNLHFKDLIIKETANYTLVNKPPFLSSLEDRNDNVNLLSLAREVDERYQVCHRIDKVTSGIVVLSKNQDAYRNFAIQLESRKVKKIYHAVVESTQFFDNFQADEPIYTTTNKSRVEFKLGKPSLTLIQTLECFKKHSLLKCFPVTGRMHQIRVHLAYHGSPIANDHSYGGSDTLLSHLKKNYVHKIEKDERPLINRFALHAYEIAFLELDGSVISTEASYPKDLETLIKALKKYN